MSENSFSGRSREPTAVGERSFGSVGKRSLAKCRLEVREDVLDVLGTDGEADQIGSNACFNELCTDTKDFFIVFKSLDKLDGLEMNQID